MLFYKGSMCLRGVFSVKVFSIFGAFVTAMLLIAMFSMASSHACTPGIPCDSYTPGDGQNDPKASYSNACDGDFMNQIYARAVLEAQRENMANQVIIRKPDSVLEYSCYGDMVNVVAGEAPPLFSESDKWASRNVNLSTAGYPQGSFPARRTVNVDMGDGHILSRLQNAVLGPFGDYIDNNFGHSFLGDASTMNPAVTSTASQQSSINCTRMQAIWQIAKCENFDITNIRTLEDLAANDPRNLVFQCNNSPRVITATNILISENPAPPHPTVILGQPSPGIPYAWVQMDGIRHTDDTTADFYSDPLMQLAGGDCAPPIPSGSTSTINRVVFEDLYDVPTIETVEVVEFQEAVCPNPQCRYEINENPSQIGECVPRGSN